MPFFTLRTNIPESKIPADFSTWMTTQLSRILGQPEQFVMLHLEPGQKFLTFGGTTEPCASGEFSQIGLNKEKISYYSSELFKCVEEKLGIRNDRMMIQFYELTADCLGVRGSSYAELRAAAAAAGQK